MVEKLSQAAVLVRLNTDTPEGKELSQAFHLRGIPTTVLLSPDGKEIDRILGYGNRSEWTRTLLAYLYGVDTLDDLLSRAASSPSPALYKEIAAKYLGRGDGREALVWVRKTREAAKPAEDTALLASLGLIEGEALLREDPPRGEALLRTLVTGPDKNLSEEAFSILSAHYRRAARKAPSPEEKEKALAAMLGLYHDLLPTKGEDPDFLNDYAWHCAEQGVELERAAEAARKAVALSGEDPGILDTLAEVYYKMGKKAEALEAIEKALAKNPDDSYLQGQKKKIATMEAPPR